MAGQQNINYIIVAEAIDYIKVNFKDQPNLDEVAKKINLNPFFLQIRSQLFPIFLMQ